MRRSRATGERSNAASSDQCSNPDQFDKTVSSNGVVHLHLQTIPMQQGERVKQCCKNKSTPGALCIPSPIRSGSWLPRAERAAVTARLRHVRMEVEQRRERGRGLTGRDKEGRSAQVPHCPTRTRRRSRTHSPQLQPTRRHSTGARLRATRALAGAGRGVAPGSVDPRRTVAREPSRRQLRHPSLSQPPILLEEERIRGGRSRGRRRLARSTPEAAQGGGRRPAPPPRRPGSHPPRSTHPEGERERNNHRSSLPRVRRGRERATGEEEVADVGGGGGSQREAEREWCKEGEVEGERCEEGGWNAAQERYP